MDEGDVPRDGDARSGAFGVAVEVVVDKGVLVPLGDEGVVLGDGAAHAVGVHDLGVGEVAHEDAAGPSADGGVRAEEGVELGVGEVEEAAFEALDAAGVAVEERGGGEGEEGVEERLGLMHGNDSGVKGWFRAG